MFRVCCVSCWEHNNKRGKDSTTKFYHSKKALLKNWLGITFWARKSGRPFSLIIESYDGTKWSELVKVDDRIFDKGVIHKFLEGIEVPS